MKTGAFVGLGRKCSAMAAARKHRVFRDGVGFVEECHPEHLSVVMLADGKTVTVKPENLAVTEIPEHEARRLAELGLAKSWRNVA